MFDVVVIGAGMAGLAAARTLAEAGKRVVLIEARDRGWGEILTVPSASGDLPIELGAEFIHGLPAELHELVEEAGLKSFELDGESRCVDPVAGLGPMWGPARVHQVFEDVGAMHGGFADLTFSEFIAQKKLSPAAAARATNYVEGFNAADADRISVLSLARQQAAENEIEGDRLFGWWKGMRGFRNFSCRSSAMPEGSFWRLCQWPQFPGDRAGSKSRRVGAYWRRPRP